MSREYPAHPLPAVLAMVARDGRVLLVRRNKEPRPEKWGFPGGLLEVGETVADGACRELAEETGVVAEALGVEDVVDVITRDEDGRVKHHYVLTCVRCRWQAGEPVAASDAVEAGWFTLDDIAAMPCHPHLHRLAQTLLA